MTASPPVRAARGPRRWRALAIIAVSVCVSAGFVAYGKLSLRAANAEAQAIAGDGLKGPKGMMWSQTPGLRANADGSVDVFFGSTAPAGKESNWVPTSADGGFEVLFRFYGPEKPLFEKTWKLPDIEETK